MYIKWLFKLSIEIVFHVGFCSPQSSAVHMRPCLNESQKEYCVKTKLMALDCNLVTLVSWCIMNRDIHNSPVMHKVEDKTLFFYSWKHHEKLPIFLFYLRSIFKSTVFISVFLLIKMIIRLYFTHV